jgi:hypothetical protein
MNTSRSRWSHATIEEKFQTVFSVDPFRGYMIRPTELSLASECSTVEWSDLVGEQPVRGLLQFGRCELLLLEAGIWGKGTVREPRVRRTSAAGSRYQATTGEYTAHLKDAVNCRVCELAIALWLLVVTIIKCFINSITNLNPLYRHSYTWQYTIYMCVCVFTSQAHMCRNYKSILLSEYIQAYYWVSPTC